MSKFENIGVSLLDKHVTEEELYSQMEYSCSACEVSCNRIACATCGILQHLNARLDAIEVLHPDHVPAV